MAQRTTKNAVVFIVSAVVVVALFTLAVLTSVDLRTLVAGTLKSGGCALYKSSGGDITELVTTTQPCTNCDCDTTAASAQSVDNSSYQTSALTHHTYSYSEDTNDTELSAVTTLAPTVQESWVVLWTEGRSDLSYVCSRICVS